MQPVKFWTHGKLTNPTLFNLEPSHLNKVPKVTRTPSVEMMIGVLRRPLAVNRTAPIIIRGDNYKSAAVDHLGSNLPKAVDWSLYVLQTMVRNRDFDQIVLHLIDALANSDWN